MCLTFGVQFSKKLTGAVFLAAFDIRYDMAAVRLQNKKIGIVNAEGRTICEVGYFMSAKFVRDYFLMVKTQGGSEQYVDLYNFRLYENRPTVKRYGNIELLKSGHAYYSRTRSIYINCQGIENGDISYQGFYLTVFDNNASVPYGFGNYSYDNRCGYACLLDGDHESYYWIYRWLDDGSIVIRDKAGRYYHVAEGNDKQLIVACDASHTDDECRAEIERWVKRIEENIRRTAEERKTRRLQILSALDDAMPFKSGMKWGLKVGGRITVPPIYRNVKPPVGKYCAVEKNYSQWGVITLDGKVLIEPRYHEVNIADNDIAILTTVTGKKMSVRLE